MKKAERGNLSLNNISHKNHKNPHIFLLTSYGALEVLKDDVFLLFTDKYPH